MTQLIDIINTDRITESVTQVSTLVSKADDKIESYVKMNLP